MKNYEQISIDDYSFKKVEVRLCLKEDSAIYSTDPITNPDAAVNVMADVMRDLDREMVAVVNLDAKNRPINFNIVSIGSVNRALAPVQNIMKSGILANAASIMLLHVHPSGDVNPSAEDRHLTVKLIEAGKLMKLPVLDHVILGSGTGFKYSFREHEPGLFGGEYQKDVLKLGEKGGAR